MKITPGNLKYILDEWKKTEKEQDIASSDIDPFVIDEYGVSSTNPQYTKARDTIWSEKAKELHPLANEYDLQEKLASRDKELNIRAKYEALRQLLNGSNK